MAYRYFTGYDLWNNSNSSGIADGWNANPNALITPGRFSGQCARYSNATTKAIPGAALSTISVGVAFKPTDLSASREIFRLMTGITIQLTLFAQVGGSIVLVRGNNIAVNVLGTSAAGIINTAGFTHLELLITRSATVGTFALHVNGSTTAAFTGTSANTGPADFDTIGVHSTSQSDYDDLYIWDTLVQQGDLRIETLRPSTTDGVAQWTPLSSTNLSNIDDTTTDNDTTYNSSSTVTQLDSFGVTALSSTPSSIKAVGLFLCARKDDAGVREVRSRVKSVAAVTNGANKAMASSYSIFQDIVPLDPNTGAAWTAAGVNAAKVQYEVMV